LHIELLAYLPPDHSLCKRSFKANFSWFVSMLKDLEFEVTILLYLVNSNLISDFNCVMLTKVADLGAKPFSVFEK
jgi:hypothetical protein